MKVVAGFFSFTEITDPTEHRSYNAWHLLDHLPEQLTLPGIGWGQRWVSTPACEHARTVNDPAFHCVHYLTLYLLAPPLDQTLADFGRLARDLSDRGRFHRHRRTALTGTFEIVETSAASRVRVSGDAVPYRPNLGIHVRLDEVIDVGRGEEHGRWLAGEHVPALVALPGVAGVWTFRRAPLDSLAEQRITVAWLDAPPLEAVEAIGALAEPPPGMVRPLLDGPFASIEPDQWDWFE